MIRKLLLPVLFAFGAVITNAGAQTPAVNYQGLWWNPNESGWGINFAHQGDVIFATWFTYDTDGKPWWLISTLNKSGGRFTGDVYTVGGQPFNSEPWLQSRMKGTAVGSMALTFTAANKGSLTYSVNGVSQTKAIEKELFGAEPTCIFGAQPDLTKATNYTDLWWNPSESGWGINLTDQSDTIYATWFTYDGTGNPWWLVATMKPDASGATYKGDISTFAGSPFGATPWDLSRVKATTVGTMTGRFADGNHANITYTVNGITQTKAITRQVFVAPGTVCTDPAPPRVGTLSMCDAFSLFGGCWEVSLPYSVTRNSSQTIVSIPPATEVIVGSYELTAKGGTVTIDNLSAVDLSGTVRPYFSGLTEGMKIADGETVTVELMSPMTRYATAHEVFVFFANGVKVFEAQVSLRTN